MNIVVVYSANGVVSRHSAFRDQHYYSLAVR